MIPYDDLRAIALRSRQLNKRAVPCDCLYLGPE